MPSIETGNKILSFKASVSDYPLLGLSMRSAPASLAAQLFGMFFLAESSRTAAGQFTTSPPELTCYRRNLFQITGSVTLPRLLQYALAENGERLRIVSQELTISASESVENGPIRIISVPWKTPVGGSPPSAEDKAEREPSPIPLDPQASRDIDAEYSVYPISWKRLQFRVATANNGRRKELQQHFIVKLSVMATLGDGSKISLCDAHSGPIIVRGRSPRNFQARKDVPLSGCGTSIRKAVSTLPPQALPQSLRRSMTDSVRPANGSLDHSGVNTGYSIPPARNGSPAIATTLDWQPAAHAPTAPISPYNSHVPSDANRTAGPPLKRKFDDSNVVGQLATPAQPSSPYARSSAPPHDRPRKVPRARGNTIGGDMVSALLSHQPQQSERQQISLPPSSFSFRATTTSAPVNFYGQADRTSQATGGEDVSAYFGGISNVDDWMQPAAPYYRPQPMHPTAGIAPATTVGGSVLSSRSFLGELA